MNKLNYFFGVVITILFYGCDCDQKFDCGTLSNESLAWLNQNLHDTITFVNDDGDRIKFIVNAKSLSQPVNDIQACKGGPVFCSCDFSCQANGRFYAVTDSAINNSRSYSIDIDESGIQDKNSFADLTYSIFDFTYKFQIKTFKLNDKDSTLNYLQLGIHTYSDVYVQSIDTLKQYYQFKKIWKAYFTKSLGVVGFRNRQTQTLYYRD